MNLYLCIAHSNSEVVFHAMHGAHYALKIMPFWYPLHFMAESFSGSRCTYPTGQLLKFTSTIARHTDWSAGPETSSRCPLTIKMTHSKNRPMARFEFAGDFSKSCPMTELLTSNLRQQCSLNLCLETEISKCAFTVHSGVTANIVPMITIKCVILRQIHHQFTSSLHTSCKFRYY